MTNESINLRIRVLLTLQVSLLGSITSDMRMISVSWDKKMIRIRFVFDRSISFDKMELIGEVESEVISHFPDFTVACESEVRSCEKKIAIRKGEVVVFRRREGFAPASRSIE